LVVRAPVDRGVGRRAISTKLDLVNVAPRREAVSTEGRACADRAGDGDHYSAVKPRRDF
jgi:hypothetical protein